MRKYHCSLCRHEWVVQQLASEPPQDDCAKCGSRTAVFVCAVDDGGTLRHGQEEEAR